MAAIFCETSANRNGVLNHQHWAVHALRFFCKAWIIDEKKSKEEKAPLLADIQRLDKDIASQTARLADLSSQIEHANTMKAIKE